MEKEYFTILIHLGAAVLAGGLIGLERTYHGRPAGFRTHTLVCTASSLLMLLTVYQWELLAGRAAGNVRVDPTRMAQGIMTGIGFLGAGVIMKEGLTVRGLTTAASIWMTASIGILFGIGFYFPAIVATLLTLGTLSLFRWIEAIMPSQYYARLHVRFKRQELLPEPELRDLITAHGFSVANLSYQLADEGKVFEYQMTSPRRQPRQLPAPGRDPHRPGAGAGVSHLPHRRLSHPRKLEHDRPVVELVAVLLLRWIMPGELCAHGADAVQNAFLEFSLAEQRFHFTTYFFPAFGAHTGLRVAVGDNLDVAIRQQQINQNPVVQLRVPYPQLGEHFQRAFTR